MELSKAFDYAFTIILVGFGTIILLVVQTTPNSLQPAFSYVGITALVFGGLLIATGYLSFIINYRFGKLESSLQDLKTLVLVGEEKNE